MIQDKTRKVISRLVINELEANWINHSNRRITKIVLYYWYTSMNDIDGGEENKDKGDGDYSRRN